MQLCIVPSRLSSTLSLTSTCPVRGPSHAYADTAVGLAAPIPVAERRSSCRLRVTLVLSRGKALHDQLPVVRGLRKRYAPMGECLWEFASLPCPNGPAV